MATEPAGASATPLAIAVDGPAASGKGTLARRLAAEFGLSHLDTGLTFRAVAAALLNSGSDLEDADAAETAARSIDLDALDRQALSTHAIGEAASRIAVLPGVRAVLAARQRTFATQGSGAVLDGRDIGTVVLPDAAVKLYVTASPSERARRRTAEMSARGEPATYDAVLADLRRRDTRDAERAAAPLAKAADAHLLDTTGMDIETAFREAVGIVERVRAGRA